MVPEYDISTIGVFCSFLALFIFGCILYQRGHGTLPPGPKGYPLIGNLLDMPTRQEWVTFGEWGERYGKICSITVLGRTTVILNSAKTAKEILEKKSSMYSDRPVMQMAGNLVGWRNGLSLMPYGDRVRLHRRLIHGSIGSKASIQEFSFVEQAETHRFLRRVLANPAYLAQQVRHTAGAIVTRIAYGYEAKENNDPFLEVAEKALSQLSDLIRPGHYMVDVLPMLRHIPAWFPGAGFKRKAKDWAATLVEAVDRPFNFVKHELVK
ncbi:hypothetical protein C0992_008204 [Termitomyces sp. T32_za158]|nr:hypothetical protein C0992_008204 [Termitomyces sp. T32_za158]